MRGKTVLAVIGHAELVAASMRPPQNAGENTRRLRTPPVEPRGFNEAPAECGGKPVWHDGREGDAACFNEAPAECGGKPARALYDAYVTWAASMRPPQNAGENRPSA